MRSHQRFRRSSSNQANRRQRDQTSSTPASSESEMAKLDKKWILLNVGGSYFLTSKQTLSRLTSMNSPLYRLSNSSTNILFDRDDRGAYLIDRDPVYFAVVLNYLRHGHLLLTRDVTEEGVLLEAEYFNIPNLQQQIKQRISNRSLNLLLMNQQQQQQQQPTQPAQPPQHQQQQQQQSSDYLNGHHQLAIGNNQQTINNNPLTGTSAASPFGSFGSFGFGGLAGLLEA